MRVTDRYTASAPSPIGGLWWYREDTPRTEAHPAISTTNN